MRALADAPYGKAAEVLRKHDPLFGVKDGDKIKWSVHVTTTSTATAYTEVEAGSEEEAIELVSKRGANSFDWEVGWVDDFDVDGADPVHK